MRTDIHSPKNLVTEDYEYLGCYDSESSGKARQNLINRVIVEAGRSWAKVTRNNGDEGSWGCFHCGANIRYVALMLHKPTNTVLKIGETCLDNRFERATSEFHTMRKQAELDRQEQRIKKAREEWIAANAEVHAHMVEFATTNGFYADLLRKLTSYGTLSENQTAAVVRGMARDRQYRAEKAAREATAAATPKANAPDGKATVRGVVVSTRLQESGYGDVIKMLVELPGLARVWGTMPAAITAKKGDEVEFTATFERKSDDPSFAFYKRPTKASITKEAVE